MNQNTIWIEKIKLRRCHIYLQLTLLACVSEAGTSLRLDLFIFSQFDQKTKKYEYEIIVTVVSFVPELCIPRGRFSSPLLTVFAFFVDHRNRP